MNEWQIALLIGAGFTSLVSCNVPRAWIWILVMAASFVFSTAYSRLGLPYYPFATMMADAGVCMAIFFIGKARWEFWLFNVFRLSVLISLVYILSNTIGFKSHYVYVTALEAVNWIALLLIGGTAIQKWAGNAHELGSRDHRLGRVHWTRSSLIAPRRDHPFHHKKTSK